MLGSLRQILISPLVGPVASAAALALAVALGISASGWRHERAAYEARISELTAASERAQTVLRTQLSACHAASDPRRMAESEPGGARQLLEQQPAGIDACARMESADRAVLSNLEE
jgi:hypothetical protein